MRNFYQEILFECQTHRHKSVAGQMRFWHVHQMNCYPNGCHSGDGFHVPRLSVPEDEYQTFLKQFHEFCRWTKKMNSKAKVSFAGIIDRIYPYFSISMLESSPIFKNKGVVLTFNQGMIQDEFFEDPFYVLVSCEDFKEFNLSENDSVSGSAHFNIDQRGIITLDRLSRIRLVNSFLPQVEWDIHRFDGMSLRIIDHLDQDLCMDCPHRFMAASRNVKQKKYLNVFVCTLGSCAIRQRIAENNQDRHLPGPDYLPQHPLPISTSADYVQEENPRTLELFKG